LKNHTDLIIKRLIRSFGDSHKTMLSHWLVDLNTFYQMALFLANALHT